MLGRLNPIISLGEELYMIRVRAMAAVSQGQLRKRVGSAAAIADELLRAVDILMRGFCGVEAWAQSGSNSTSTLETSLGK
jgi:hypothetical protein